MILTWGETWGLRHRDYDGVDEMIQMFRFLVMNHRLMNLMYNLKNENQSGYDGEEVTNLELKR